MVTQKDIAWLDEDIRESRVGTVHDHGSESDLVRLVELAEPKVSDVALDMVTGLGHTARALAPHVKRVDAIDPDRELIKDAESLTDQTGLKNINFYQGSPTELDFEKNTYNIAVARMALRHLGNAAGLLKEANRVLKGDGRLVLVDTLAPPHPDLADFQLKLMALRDPSHVKNYSLAELENLLEREDFDIEAIEIYPKEHDFNNWAKRLGAANENIRMLAATLQGASDRVKRHFRVQEKGNKLVSFITWMILLSAKPSKID